METAKSNQMDEKTAAQVEKHKKRGLVHVYWALMNSLSGLWFLMHETAFWHEAVLGIVLGVLAWFVLPFTAAEALFLSIMWLLVFIVEILNTAIEAVVDLVSPDYHILAKKAKDLGSAAVAAIMVCNIVAWIGFIVLAATRGKG